MIYNTNLDFRMMHILDAFDTSSMHSTTDCMNIANFLQVALYLKCCSKMVKDIEPTGFISKSKVRNKIGFYISVERISVMYSLLWTNWIPKSILWRI